MSGLERLATSALLHEPAASSRDFLVTSKAPGRRLSFIDLPEAVRTQIYQLAIYDHDRTAVFLPRAVPRKVVPDIDDVNVELIEAYPPSVVEEWKLSDLVGHIAESSSVSRGQYRPDFGPYFLEASVRHWTKLLRPLGPEETAASGVYVDEDEDIAASTFTTLGRTPEEIAKLGDYEILEALDDDADFTDSESKEDSEVDKEPPAPRLSRQEMANRATAKRRTEELIQDPLLDDDPEELDTDPDCSCCASSPASKIDTGYPEAQSIAILIEQVPALESAGKPEETGETKAEADVDEEDNAGEPEKPEEMEAEANVHEEKPAGERTRKDGNVFTMNDHDDADDVEHYDTDELVGMLYELREPGILLARKDIRKACLPIYYCRNAFSWRFVWTNYERSCKRFKAWTKSVGSEHAKLISKVTFQGRHMVEEGLEYSADIDILGEHPYFETTVYTDDCHLNISQHINAELAEYCWLTTQEGERRLTMTPGLLCKLASIFVQGMHRDNAGWLADGAAECKEQLSPFLMTRERAGL